MMYSDDEKKYSYRYLLSIILLFSGLTNFSLLCYWFVQKSFFIPLEPLIVGIVICVSFSALGQRLSKIDGIGKWIFGISTYSSIANYMLFISSRTIDLLTILFIFVVLFFLLPFLFWTTFLQPLSKSILKYMSQVKFSTRARVTVLGGSLLVIFILVFASIFSQEIISFFDTHAWVMTLIGIVVSILVAFIGGISIGRKKRS